MRISTTSTDQHTILHIHSSRLDALIADDLKSMVGEAMARATVTMVDLDEVKFIDSSGLGALVGALRSRSKVSFINVCPAVRTVFRLTRVDRTFQVVE